MSDLGPTPTYKPGDVVNGNMNLAPVTSLVTGLIAFFSRMPIAGMIAWVLAPLALLFGILGLRSGKTEHKMSWSGIVCGAIALLICILYGVFILIAMANDEALT